MPKLADQRPEKLKPFFDYGLDLEYNEGDTQAECECPWCGREGKFSINIGSGLWRCMVCGEGSDKGGGNVYVFIRHLWKLGLEQTKTEDYKELAKQRNLLHGSTLRQWGLCKSPIDGAWLVPGFAWNGTLNNLYPYRQITKPKPRWVLKSVSTLFHQMHGVNLYNATKPHVILCEGIWDACALWEALINGKSGDNGSAPSGNEEASYLADTSVLAIPGAQTFHESFAELFKGKQITLMGQNDHWGAPKKEGGKPTTPGSLSGMQRIAGILSSITPPPEEIRYLYWGKDEPIDNNLPHGYDLRDFIGARS